MRRKFLAALVCAASVAAIAATTATAGGGTECNSVYFNTTLKSVVVNPGDFCVLENVTVIGGLSQTGGTLWIFPTSTVKGGFTVTGGDLLVEGTTVKGGWSISGNTYPDYYFCGDNIDGGLSLNGTTSGGTFSFGELNSGCQGGTINGGATLTNNAGTVELDGYQVNGGLTFIQPAGTFNELEATAVNGSATCQNVVDDGSSAPQVNSFTGQNNGCPT